MFTLSSRTSPCTLAPGVSSCMRFKQRSSVLLPHPDGPMIAVTVCAGNRSDTSRTARWCPKSAVRCAASRRSRVLADATIALPREPTRGERDSEHKPHEDECRRPGEAVPLVERPGRVHVNLQRQRLHGLRDREREGDVAEGCEEQRGGFAGNTGDPDQTPGDDPAERRASHHLERGAPARI